MDVLQGDFAARASCVLEAPLPHLHLCINFYLVDQYDRRHLGGQN